MSPRSTGVPPSGGKHDGRAGASTSAGPPRLPSDRPRSRPASCSSAGTAHATDDVAARGRTRPDARSRRRLALDPRVAGPRRRRRPAPRPRTRSHRGGGGHGSATGRERRDARPDHRHHRAGPDEPDQPGRRRRVDRNRRRQHRRQHRDRQRQRRRCAGRSPARRSGTQVALVCSTSPTGAAGVTSGNANAQGTNSTGGIAQLTNIDGDRQRPGRRLAGRADHQHRRRHLELRAPTPPARPVGPRSATAVRPRSAPATRTSPACSATPRSCRASPSSAAARTTRASPSSTSASASATRA